MPTTKSRIPFLSCTIKSLAMQDLGDSCELVVVSEDWEALEQAERLRKGLPGQFVLCNKGTTLGKKRNLCFELANSNYITFWDDDDWSRRDRLKLTVETIYQNKGVDLIGSETMLIHELLDTRRRTYVYKYASKGIPTFPDWYYLGGLLTVNKNLWDKYPLNNEDICGEETWWEMKLPSSIKRVELTTDPTIYVQMLHGNNTGFKQSSLPFGSPEHLPYGEGNFSINRLMGEDLCLWEKALLQFNKSYK